MTTQQIIEELRLMLNDSDSGLTQAQYDALCAAIRALGGNP